MTAPVFTHDELWIVAFALRDKRKALVERRDDAVKWSTEPKMVLEPARFEQWAADDTRRIAELDAVWAKLPEQIRQVWAQLDAKDAAEAAAA
jgi:hypothetical protein